MPLFNTGDDSLFDDEIKSESVKAPTDKQILKISGRYLSLKAAIGDITPETTIHFISAGQWSMHDLLAYILRYTGPADVRCFTFAWGPDATRTVINLKRNGTIRHLYIALHSVMKRWTVAAMEIMNKYAEKISLLPMHAKGFLIENENWHISVMGSANFSSNSSIECGVITNDPEIYKMHRRWLDAAFENGEKFVAEMEAEHELFTPPVHQNDKILFLIRGLPGAGKSSLAHIIADEVCENDDYFYLNGKYTFAKDHLMWAKGECLSRCRNAMEQGIKKIAIANTFCDPAGMIPYQQLAKMFGYSVFTIVTENRQRTTNIHDVQHDVITKMQRSFKVKLC